MKPGFWKETVGWFDFPNIYDRAVALGEDGDVFIEIGVFMGASIVYLSQKIEESGKDIKIVGIDPFAQRKQMLRELYNQKKPIRHAGNFWWKLYLKLRRSKITPVEAARQCIDESGYGSRVRLVKAAATACVDQFDDKSVKFVFIDDNHRFPVTSKNINCYWEKLADGGVMAGHDYAHDEVARAVNCCIELKHGLPIEIIEPVAVGVTGDTQGPAWWVDKPE